MKADGFVGNREIHTDQGFVAAVGEGNWLNITVANTRYELVNANEAEQEFKDALQEAMLKGPLSDQIFPLDASWLNP